jgi:hypothetical protein
MAIKGVAVEKGQGNGGDVSVYTEECNKGAERYFVLVALYELKDPLQALQGQSCQGVHAGEV